MPRIDDEYIKALQSFTGALEAIVETLKKQQKGGKADTVNEMLKNVPNNLEKVVNDLKKVTHKGFSELKDDNKKILKKIEGIKQQKESGMFDKVEDPKNKNKIVDGIKVVILIAAGVLALGLAFKIIGVVDFLSVVALSVAMIAMAKTYKELSDIKGLTYSKIFMTALMLPVMSFGLLLSGLILSNFPTFGFGQSVSLILVGAGLGVAAYFLLSSISKVNIKKDWATILLLPQILPLIAEGLFFAGLILSNFPTFGFGQSVSLILVSTALGIAAFLLLSSLGKIDIKKDWATILLIPAILPLIAYGIVKASEILQGYMPLKQPWKLLIDSLVLGLSVLFFVPSVILIGMFIKDWTSFSIGILGAIAVAGAIVGIAYIFKALPSKFETPPLMWSLKTGLSLLMFSVVALLIAVVLSATLSLNYDTGKGATAAISGGAGGKFENLALGVLGLITVAGAIVAISYIITLFKPGPGIDPKWTLSVGLAMLTFSVAVILTAILMNSTLSLNYDFGKGGSANLSGTIGGDWKTLAKGFLAVIGVALTLVVVSQILRLFDGSVRIDPEWSINVGLTLLTFGAAGFLIGIIVKKNQTALLYGLIAIVGIAAAILAVDWLLSKGDYTKYPSVDWLTGVGLAIVGFAVVAGIIGAIMVLTGGTAALALAAGLISIIAIAGAIWLIDKILAAGKYTKYPSVDWLEGVGLAIVGLAVVAGVIGAIMMLTGGIAALALAAGLIAIIGIASSMLAVDKIFSSGTFKNYPSKEWATGVAASMTIFSTMDASGDTDKGFWSTLGGALKGFVKGASGSILSSSMIDMAMAMTKIDFIFNQGNFDKYPSKEWSEGAAYFVLTMGIMVEGWTPSVKDIINFSSSINFLVPSVKLFAEIPTVKKDFMTSSTYIRKAIDEISKGVYEFNSNDISVTEYRDFNAAMIFISKAMDKFLKIPVVGSLFLPNIRLIRASLKELSLGIDEFMYDKGFLGVFKTKKSMADFEKFSNGLKNVAEGLKSMAQLKPIPDDSINSFNKFLEFLNKMPKNISFLDKIDDIKKLSDSLLNLAESLNKLNGSLNGFLNMSKGLFLISIIDDVKLGKVLESVQKHKATLQVINKIPEEQSNLTNMIRSMYETSKNNTTLEKTSTSSEISNDSSNKTNKKEDTFYSDISEIKGLLIQLVDHANEPSGESFHEYINKD